MNSLRGRRYINDALQRAGRRAGGQLPSPMILQGGHAIDHNVQDITALPVAASNADVQTSSGQAVFLIGYSAVGGPDVIG